MSRSDLRYLRGCMQFMLGVAVILASPGYAAGTPARLRTSTPPALVDCAPVTQMPCMGAGLTPVDEGGAPAPVNLPAAADLARAFTLRDGEREITPFYASAGLGPDAAQHSNVTLLLIDISGSMNRPAPGSTSRIAAVKSAVAEFLKPDRAGDSFPPARDAGVAAHCGNPAQRAASQAGRRPRAHS